MQEEPYLAACLLWDQDAVVAFGIEPLDEVRLAVLPSRDLAAKTIGQGCFIAEDFHFEAVTDDEGGRALALAMHNGSLTKAELVAPQVAGELQADHMGDEQLAA